MNRDFIEIVNVAKSGDNRAFEALYNMTKDSAYFIALSITKNEQDAMDILQDSYIKAFGSLGTLKQPELFDSWLNRIVSNNSKNYLNKKKPMLFADITTDIPQEWNEEELNRDYIPHESVDSKETSRLVMEIINKLSEDKRLVILMYYYQSMSVAEISETLELPVTTVKYKLLSARQEIKKGIEDLEKKGTKLYSVAPLAIIPAVLALYARNYTAPAFAAVMSGVSSSASAVSGTVSAVKSGFLSTVAGKITVAAVAVAIIGGGITAAVVIGNNNNTVDESPVANSSTASSTESSNTVSSDDVSYTESSETVSDESQSTSLSENIIRLEELYEDDDERHTLIEGLQGKIKYIEQDGTSLVFLADNKLYVSKYSTLSSQIELPDNPQWIQYFDNLNIGGNLYYYADNKISLYNNYGDFRFKDIDFNIETDCAYTSLGNALFVLSEQSDGYMIKHYEVDDEHTVTSYEENMLTEYKNSNGEDITDQIKEVKVIPSNEDGFALYCITKNNELYCVSSIHTTSLVMTTAEPVITNIDELYVSSYMATYMATPIYSKVGDETTVYSMAPGASLSESEDNLEISFLMPDGHVPSEIKEVSESYGMLIFVFSNGDTYITNEIEDDKQTEYQMTRLDEISELNADGKVIDMVGGGSVLEKYIYLLTDTNELYAYIVE